RLEARRARQHRENSEIGQLMQELISAEYRPIETLVDAQAVALVDVQLQPVDMIMDQQLRDHDSQDQRRIMGEQQDRGQRSSRMQAGMDKSRAVAVNSLVAVEISGLQHKIAEKMLYLEQHEARQKKRDAGTQARGLRGACAVEPDPGALERCVRGVIKPDIDSACFDISNKQQA